LVPRQRTAENLYLTPAAVSARIKQLEEFFATILFTRNRNSIQLTQAGEKLLPYARQLVDTLKQARQVLNEQDAAFLTFGATPNASSLILDELFANCSAYFADMAITTEIHCTEQLSRQLHERTIDFALTTEPLKSSDIETIILREEPLFLFTIEDQVLDDQLPNFVHIDWSHKATAELFSAFPKCKHYKFKTNDSLAGIRYANKHLGSVVLTETLKQKLTQANQFNHHLVGEVRLYCAYLKDHPHPIVDEVIARLRGSEE
jgi:DNA-binding transcriptional LysR family regulator